MSIYSPRIIYYFSPAVSPPSDDSTRFLLFVILIMYKGWIHYYSGAGYGKGGKKGTKGGWHSGGYYGYGKGTNGGWYGGKGSKGSKGASVSRFRLLLLHISGYVLSFLFSFIHDLTTIR